MNSMIELSVLFISSLISSSFLTWLLIKQLSLFGLVDMPGARRAHKKITPRGGGLSIVTVLVLGFIIFEYFSSSSLIQSVKIIPVFLLISLVSFLDDIKNVPIFIRLVFHIFCASSTIYLFLYPIPLFHEELPLYADFILATISFTAFINIYNFLDGIDGITAAESIHLSITILIICYLRSEVIIKDDFIIVIATIILASAIGFSIFNWAPAKIFLGDVGSISLGFLIGLCLLLISASGERLFAASIIASLYYIADGGLTILIRFINKEKIWQPHLKHFFQKAVKKGMTHKQVVQRIIFCNFFLMLLSVNSLYYPVISIVLAILVVIITLVNFTK